MSVTSEANDETHMDAKSYQECYESGKKYSALHKNGGPAGLEKDNSDVSVECSPVRSRTVVRGSRIENSKSRLEEITGGAESPSTERPFQSIFHSQGSALQHMAALEVSAQDIQCLTRHVSENSLRAYLGSYMDPKAVKGLEVSRLLGQPAPLYSEFPVEESRTTTLENTPRTPSTRGSIIEIDSPLPGTQIFSRLMEKRVPCEMRQADPSEQQDSFIPVDSPVETTSLNPPCSNHQRFETPLYQKVARAFPLSNLFPHFPPPDKVSILARSVPVSTVPELTTPFSESPCKRDQNHRFPSALRNLFGTPPPFQLLATPVFGSAPQQQGVRSQLHFPLSPCPVQPKINRETDAPVQALFLATTPRTESPDPIRTPSASRSEVPQEDTPDPRGVSPAPRAATSHLKTLGQGECPHALREATPYQEASNRATPLLTPGFATPPTPFNFLTFQDADHWDPTSATNAATKPRLNNSLRSPAADKKAQSSCIPVQPNGDGLRVPSSITSEIQKSQTGRTRAATGKSGTGGYGSFKRDGDRYRAGPTCPNKNEAITDSGACVAAPIGVGTSPWKVLYEFASYGYARSGKLFSERNIQKPPQWPLDPMPATRLNLELLKSLAQAEHLEAEVNILKYLEDEHFSSLTCTKCTPVYSGESKYLAPFLGDLVKSGILKPLPRRKAKIWMSAFLVPKQRKRTLRAILNAIPLNEIQEMVPGPLELPGLSDIADMIRRHDFFCETDGKSWYNQFDLPQAALPFFAIRVSGRTYAWSTLPMGWKSSVKIAHAATSILHHLPGAKSETLMFIDNGYRFSNSTKDLENDIGEVLVRAEKVSATLVVTTPPQEAGTILGVQVDLSRKTLCLPREFIEKLVALRNTFETLQRIQSRPSHRLVWKVLGTIFWAARVLGIAQCDYITVMLWIRNRARFLSCNPIYWDKTCWMRPEFVTALIELLNRIEINTPRSVGESADESERIYVDASQGRWGLAWWEAGNLRDRSGIFPSWLKEKPIAYKELYAAEMGLKECKERKLKNVTIISDNKNVVSWMSRWCAGPPLIMSWLQRLRNDYYVKGTFREIIWTSSDTNLADAPSRRGGSA